MLNRLILFLMDRFVLIMIFFNTPTILSELLAPELTFRVARHIVADLLYTVFIATAITAILSMIKSSLAKIFKCIILIICATGFLADVFALTYYGTLVNRTMLEIILATNPNEATEFLTAYALQPKFLMIVLLSIIILIALYKVNLPHVKEKFVKAFLIITLIIVGAKLVSHPIDVFEQGNSITRLAIVFPEVLKDMHEYEKLASASNHSVTLTKNDSNLPLVIFIIGESTTRNHMQLYGYDVPTTPNLSARNDKGELKIFTDTVSPHAHTMPVLKELFSFMRHENEGDGLNYWLNKGNFFDILNAAGYYTCWLSNQEISGVYGNIGRLYAGTCIRKQFTTFRDSKENRNVLFDEELLPLLDNELAIEHDKSFYVLHLMGTHSVYNHRYPKSYGKFTAENRTCAEYDNAVLYNDYIVDEIIKRVENLDAIVIYISDHGEDVFDEKNFAGHEESSLSRFMIEIPFVIWTSQKFNELHPELERKIFAAVDKPFMTDDMIHLLMDMMKIETSDFDLTLSPLNENYNSERQRIYGGKIYDKELGLH